MQSVSEERWEKQFTQRLFSYGNKTLFFLAAIKKERERGKSEKDKE